MFLEAAEDIKTGRTFPLGEVKKIILDWKERN